MRPFIRYLISAEVTAYNRSEQNRSSIQFPNLIDIFPKVFFVSSPRISSDFSIRSRVFLIIMSELYNDIISLFYLRFHRCPETALLIKCFRTRTALGTIVQCSTVDHKLRKHLRPSALAVGIYGRIGRFLFHRRVTDGMNSRSLRRN